MFDVCEDSIFWITLKQWDVLCNFHSVPQIIVSFKKIHMDPKKVILTWFLPDLAEPTQTAQALSRSQCPLSHHVGCVLGTDEQQGKITFYETQGN